MNELKSTIAKNIIELRKQHGLTQLQLAEKLNYSDKAVSKWERGESIPDITVLVEIAKLFSVSLDYLVNDDHSIKPIAEEGLKQREATQKIVDKNRKAIMSICIQAVCLVATLFFVPLSLIFPQSSAKWLCFVYAVPIAVVIWLVFNSIWFNTRTNYLIISILVWSILASIHITLLLLNIKFHLIYLFGLPCQLIIILCSLIIKKPN